MSVLDCIARLHSEGKINDLPPLLAAPPVKTRYVTTDV